MCNGSQKARHGTPAWPPTIETMSRTTRASCPHLALDDAVEPAAQRVVQAVMAAVEAGSLVDGDFLPSTRRLAQEHSIARSSVVEAYEMLGGAGIVDSVPGSGTRICAGARTLLCASGEGPRRPARPHASTPHHVDLTVPAVVDSSVINLREWNKAWKEAIAPRGAPSGSAQLAEALTDHLRSFRGVTFEPRQLVLRPSIGSVIGDIVFGLDARGASVAVEDPSYPRIQRHFLNEGCRTHCIPVDDEGLRVDLLSPDDRIVHVTPARQWPTGATMSLRRRRELLEWAARTGSVIVENDIDAEFTYGRAPAPTLFSLADEHTHVCYVGSSAKLLAPELSVVWLIVDPILRRRAHDAAPVSDFSALALANFIRSGSLYRHRNRALALIEERRCALLRALKRVPGVTAVGEASGTELVIRLPRTVDEVSVQLLLEDSGYQVSTLGDFSLRRHPPALVLQYADLTPSDARAFAVALHRALQEGERLAASHA